MRRILVYSHDTYGLGNIRRMLALIEHAIGRYDDISALIVSGSPMMQAFRLSPRIDYVKIPCLLRGEDGAYMPKFLDLPYDKMMRLRADLILNTIMDFEPDLILVDKKPLGVQNELAPALQVLRKRINLPKMALVLREVFDSPQRTKRIWAKNLYHEAIAEYYDRVLVLGSPNIFDTAHEYDFPQSTRARLRYCGFLGKRNHLRPVEHVRSELRLGPEKLVVVTVGGGQDGATVLNTVCKTFSNPLLANTHFLICVGAEPDAAKRAELESFVHAHSHFSLLPFTNDMMSYMNAADLVVSMAGYNTVTELLGLNKPGVLIPRTEPVQEQWIRATRLEQHGRFITIHPDQLTPATLRRAVSQGLADTLATGAREPIDLTALDVVADEIHTLLAERDDDTWRGLIMQSAAETGADTLFDAAVASANHG